MPASSFSIWSYISNPLAKSTAIHFVFTLYWLSENCKPILNNYCALVVELSIAYQSRWWWRWASLSSARWAPDWGHAEPAPWHIPFQCHRWHPSPLKWRESKENLMSTIEGCQKERKPHFYKKNKKMHVVSLNKDFWDLMVFLKNSVFKLNCISRIIKLHFKLGIATYYLIH